MFPSTLRKYVRLGAEEAYESIVFLLRENLKADSVESKQTEPLSVKAKIGGTLGVAVEVRVFPEGGVSALEFSFSYRQLLLSSIIVLTAWIAASLVLRTAIPLVGLAFILVLGYRVNYSARSFLDIVNEALPHLERESARRALIEDRKRWQLEPKDTNSLYQRLREKHVKTWGNTNVLEYKIAEYESQGLTRNEAIRKTAEEEGIY